MWSRTKPSALNSICAIRLGALAVTVATGRGGGMGRGTSRVVVPRPSICLALTVFIVDQNLANAVYTRQRSRRARQLHSCSLPSSAQHHLTCSLAWQHTNKLGITCVRTTCSTHSLGSSPPLVAGSAAIHAGCHRGLAPARRRSRRRRLSRRDRFHRGCRRN